MKYLFPLLLAAIFCSSCNHYFYSPNSHNVPMLREQHDARLLINAVSADEISGTEIQAAYSPVEQVGVMLNYIQVHGGSGFSTGSGHMVEAGAGYYMPLDGRWNFEVYAGGGLGRVYNQFDSGGINYENRLQKIFAQPAIGYTSDYFDFIFSLRLAYLAQKPVNFESTPNPLYQALNNAADARNSFLMEPALTFRGGYKFIKLQTQFGTSTNLSNPYFPQEHFVASLGLYASFSPRWLNGGGKRKAAAGKGLE